MGIDWLIVSYNLPFLRQSKNLLISPFWFVSNPNWAKAVKKLIIVLDQSKKRPSIKSGRSSIFYKSIDLFVLLYNHFE
jgi:hypothetical protein